ncbi:hypothetical protein EV356DRAFT_507228 [Viridothelium virens]|uniref:2EXR domain-containing protein n=1 Tax=Viridothelium virens TaxID=1048519 RepID=A0A6A6H0K9_VIRVR|nr:hypothetical protein EV356DRAFT_507228 [Viridothelium virens]
MTTLPQHLQIINSSHCHSEDAKFSPFSKLPPEIRLRIWTHSLERHRLVEVEVAIEEDLPSDSGGARPYSTQNALNKLISGRNYTATVQALQLNSKLLRVTSESRNAALSFYRVHIPCHLQASKERIQGNAAPSMRTAKATKSIFYFNPEYDFIHLSKQGPAKHTFVDFLHDLKAYDPRDVGLLNLALDTNGMSLGLHAVNEVSEAPAKASFIDTLSRLQEIIWVAESHTGRAIMGPGVGFYSFGVRFNHSMPIKAITPSFDLLRRDPRPVGPELDFILTGSSDPRQLRVYWQELLRSWGIRRALPVRERVLFAYDSPVYQQQVYDTKTANKLLTEEQDHWLASQQHWHRFTISCAGKIPVEGPEELAKAVKPAIGFWLFPAEALGPLEGELWHMKKVFDMTNCWPELALSNLS